ncbi:uncharacterized protein LOC129588846 [Paramacrobiotus metropolitanus]|uniref:uncharacterized protein LOC129588846 n=1 Tax=Paramacrobiotus metropolitanus TaxID=2943436 RepID=UPI0024459D6C|nr:uncharacterized protein LOC129588846 [Paramacrobiotus metropolitanus]
MNVYLVDGLLKYTAANTQSLLVKQFYNSHTYAAMEVIHQMELPIKHYLSYKTVDICLVKELELFPTVSNLHIYCTMKTKDGTRETLEILVATPAEAKKLLASLAGCWIYCCTTTTMTGTLTGIALTLDAFSRWCRARSEELAGQDSSVHYTAVQKELQEASQHWPISPTANDLLQAAFADFVPTTAKYHKFYSGTVFCPEIFKVLIRKPRLEQIDYFESCGVASWLRLS